MAHGARVSGIAVALATLVLAACAKTPHSAAGPLLGDAAVRSVQDVASGPAVGTPLDATPDPAGTTIYFSSKGAAAGIFRVPSAGGPVVTVSVGAPLQDARGVAMSSDAAHAYVADPKADRIFSIATAGGTTGVTPTVVTGSEGWSPQGLEVFSSHGADLIYFTGTDPTSKTAGLFSIPAGGGTVTTVAKGAPFASPEGVVVAGSGVAYVTDHGAATTGSVTGSATGSVLQVSGSAVTTVKSGISLGSPAGITLSQDDKQVLVSSMDTPSGSDQLLFIDLASGKTGVANQVIGVNHLSSGGLHRAHHYPSSLAWADSRGARFDYGHVCWIVLK